MTLRLRLLLLLVGIVAIGLVVSDVVTYDALRSFLTTRVDQQLDGAAFPVGRALLSSSGLGPEVPLAPPVGSGPVEPAPGSTAVPWGRFRNGGGLFGPGRGPAGVLVPPGTFGELRSPSGKVEAHLFFSYGGKAPSAPVIPAQLPGSGLPSGRDRFFTTSSGGGSISYRAVAKPLADRRGVVVIAVPLTDVNGTLRRLLLIEAVVSALLLVGLGFVSWVMVRRDLRPLEEISETAGAIAEGDLSKRVSQVTEGTEVGQVGLAFNTMIDDIQEAFEKRAASEERLRLFMADASHELRTPLTSILGYTELFDLGVRDRPVELATSMHHIQEEARRMETLVDDLFLLARLDQERPLRRERVDVAAVMEQAAAGVRASAPDRTVLVSAASPVFVEGDADRIRQVIDNLLVNAVTHTPPGTRVEAGVCNEEGTAVLRVEDDGPGIDPAETSSIFLPFYRSDPSRTRASGGAGLGLAIVAAIVEAHGGTVAARPGPGGTFEVRLPAMDTHLGMLDLDAGTQGEPAPVPGG
jgi:two-component system OmpR family sensor kinase